MELKYVKVLLAIWEVFLGENNRNYSSYRFSHKFVFIPVLSFLRKQEKRIKFLAGCGLVTRNISVFCLQRVALYFKAIPNSINFYKYFSDMLFLFHEQKDFKF